MGTYIKLRSHTVQLNLQKTADDAKAKAEVQNLLRGNKKIMVSDRLVLLSVSLSLAHSGAFNTTPV